MQEGCINVEEWSVGAYCRIIGHIHFNTRIHGGRDRYCGMTSITFTNTIDRRDFIVKCHRFGTITLKDTVDT